MQTTRRQGREAALQALYLEDVTGVSWADLPSSVWSAEPMTMRIREFAQALVKGVAGHREALDARIARQAENWELHRMAAVDRCILRLGAYELLHERDTPVNVIINEAVEIAKRYSTGESSRFVNGILDKLKTERTV